MSTASKSEAGSVDANHFYETRCVTGGYIPSPSNTNDDWISSAWERLREAENFYGQRYRNRPRPSRKSRRRRRRI